MNSQIKTDEIYFMFRTFVCRRTKCWWHAINRLTTWTIHWSPPSVRIMCWIHFVALVTFRQSFIESEIDSRNELIIMHLLRPIGNKTNTCLELISWISVDSTDYFVRQVKVTVGSKSKYQLHALGRDLVKMITQTLIIWFNHKAHQTQVDNQSGRDLYLALSFNTD